jgi:septal ring-binding cell division protein DamX
MPIATLEEIRLLSNLETAHSKLLQIVLFGQPELEDNLRQAHIRQLRERITHSFRLSPLKPDEIGDYLNFRLRAAGYRGPDLFSPSIVRAIAKASGGLTRRVNLVADKALLAAFAENTHSVKLKHVKAAVRDSEFSHYETPPPRVRSGFALTVIGLGALAGVALWAGLQLDQQKAAPIAEPAPPPQPTAAAVAPAVEPAPVPTAPATAAAPAETPAPVATLPAEPAPPATAPAPAVAPASPPDKPAAAPIKPIKTINKQEVVETPPEPVKRGDLVEQRILATREWLAQTGNNAYTIQLLGADNQQQLKNHLNVIRKLLEINEVYVYRTIAKQKPSMTVLYGSFVDRRSAQDALNKLPATLKAFKPIIRTAQGIRAEIAQHQSP